MREEMRRRIIYGTITQDELATLEPEDVRRVKLEPVAHYSWVPAAMASTGKDPVERTFDHWGSVQKVNETGDVIVQRGWDLSRGSRKKGGMIPLLYAHQDTELPIGIVLRGRVETHPQGVPGLLLSNRVHDPDLFAEGDPHGPRTESIFRMMSAGFMPGGSVGWMPKEVRVPESDDERASFELGPHGLLYVKQTLIEFTITPIPRDSWANLKNALGMLVQQGRIAREHAEMACADCVDVEDWVERKERERVGYVQASVPNVASCGCASKTSNATNVGESLAGVRAELLEKIEGVALDVRSMAAHVQPSTRRAETPHPEASALVDSGRGGESSRSQDPTAFYARVLDRALSISIARDSARN